MQNRFSPELGRRTAQIFRQLTGGQYQDVVLDRTFHLSAEPEGDALYRDANLLSAGTVDQLYLSVRLALCRLTVPDAPILLDDALCAFDDSRMALALEALKEMGAERQILLFSCHSREAAWAAANGVETAQM